MNKCIILANGQSPKKSVFTLFEKLGYDLFICADGGADSALKLNLVPDYIIGDLDSISNKALKHYSKSAKILKYTRQNDTDVEKCLKYAIKKKCTEAVLLGATGDRLDHSFCNLGIVLKFFDKISVKIVHQKSILNAYSGKVILKTFPGEVISLYGINEKTKITSQGLKYPLQNVPLPFGQKESTSNVALSEKVKLNITGGKIFIVRDFKLLVEHGLIQHS